MPKESQFKSHRFLWLDDCIVVEAPEGLGDGERKLMQHYRSSGPKTWVFMVRGVTPSHPPDPEGVHAWGDDVC